MRDHGVEPLLGHRERVGPALDRLVPLLVVVEGHAVAEADRRERAGRGAVLESRYPGEELGGVPAVTGVDGGVVQPDVLCRGHG
ncbi:hypothetical protein GCM10023238_00050 [Streptomyces heliomycini]